MARKDSCVDLADALNKISLQDKVQEENPKEVQDEAVEQSSEEEPPQEEESMMPKAWRTSKDHPLDKVIGNIEKGVSTRNLLKDTVGHMAFVSQIEPTTISEAIGDEHWTLAMQEELNQFKRNDVWELVPRPDNHTIIGTKWVFSQ